MSVRSLLERLLAPRGLEIRDRGAHGKRYEAGMDLLVRSGFKPKTVVDIGVATGTPWLYSAFPGTQLVLIDPNPEFTADLERLKADYGADVYPHAVGAERGELTLHIDAGTPSSSSLLTVSPELTQQWARQGIERPHRSVTVPVMTLDETLSAASYQGPLLIKIDTEGFEREVMLGATETLRRTDVVIAEVSVARRFEGSYEFTEFVSLMGDRGFKLCDILSVTTFGRGGPINFLDATFAKPGVF